MVFRMVPMNELQDLTFALCHCYPNWSGILLLLLLPSSFCSSS